MAAVVIPGPRDVRGTLEEPPDGADTGVVVCPPHPQYGGSRHDPRLEQIATALIDHGMTSLRIDYGPWDGGEGERTDAVRSVEWLADRVERVGCCGYSFGAGVALRAADDSPVGATAAVAPPASDGVPAAVESIATPLLICVGTEDTTVSWQRVLEAAPPEARIERFETGHFFTGAEAAVADRVGAFSRAALSDR